ncbi:hypothetical protein KDL44_01155 [bacterium]|nr:hypothetical protein [bacterium]
MDQSVNSDNAATGAKQGGFKLWRAVIVALLIGGGIIGSMLLREFRENKLIQQAERLYEGVKAMDELTLAQISQQAHHTSAHELLESPHGLDDRFVVLDGTVSKEQSIAVSSNMASEVFNGEDYCSYVLDDQLVFVDISGGRSNFGEGDHIQGHGKVFVLRVGDLFNLPVLGEDLQKEFGSSLNEEDEVVFFLSKGVEQLDVPKQDFADSGGDGIIKR